MGNDMRKLIDQVKNFGKNTLNEESKGLWANIQAKKERGEEPAKKGDKDYPDKKQWDNLTKEEIEKTIIICFGKILKQSTMLVVSY
jgi:hypothetical protein